MSALRCSLISACLGERHFLHSFLICRGGTDEHRSRALGYITNKVEELDSRSPPVILETPLEERGKALVEDILRRRLPPPTVRKLDRARAKARDGRFFAMWAMGDDADNRALMALH